MNEVLFVGTSDAFGAGGRRQSAVLIRGERGTVLMDCGATTTMGLDELGVERNEIDTILVSHFHGDHFGGIPFFLLAALYEDQRTRPLVIAGPPEIEARVRNLADAMGYGLEGREIGFRLDFQEVPPGSSHEIGPATVNAFETRHQLEAHPHGYRINLGSRTVVYSGDTGWFPELPRLSAGADLFACECTLFKSQLDFHLSLEQLLEHQAKFDVGRMMLTHLGTEMAGRRGTVGFETADDGLRIRL
ncbi:MAG: MBL fold metallo-hydrolase [Myxococcota bacterium]|nr:MBL fold metallo-hydrolase [Myxococcota bacterium]